MQNMQATPAYGTDHAIRTSLTWSAELAEKLNKPKRFSLPAHLREPKVTCAAEGTTENVQTEAKQSTMIQTPDGPSTKRLTANEYQSAAEAAGKVSFTEPGKYTIDPQRSFVIQQLDVALAFALLYTAIVTPVDVAFLDEQHLSKREMDISYRAILVLNQIMNLLFAFDVIAQFFTHYQQPKHKGGAWVRDHKMIIAHYLRGNFIVDFIATFPFDVITRINERNRHGMRQLAKVRLLKLLRLTKLFRIMASSRLIARYRAQLTMSYGMLTLAHFVAITIVVCHWFACLWGFIGNLSPRRDGYSNSWLRKFEANSSVRWNIKSPRNQYVISLYYAITTLTTVGYGDVTPQNMSEYLVILVAMFVGGFMWAFVIGQVCALASTLDIKRIEHRQLYDQINNMLVDSAISPTLAGEVRSYLFQTEDMTRRMSFPRLLDFLSPYLQQNLCDELSARHFAAVQYFCHRSNRFRLAVFKSMLARMFCPQEHVVDDSKSLLIVANHGLVAADGAIYTIGTALNRDFISYNCPMRQIVSLSYVQVYILTRNQLDTIAVYHPEERSVLLWFRVFYGMLHAARMLRRLREMSFRKQSAVLEQCPAVSRNCPFATLGGEISQHKEYDLPDRRPRSGLEATVFQLPRLCCAQQRNQHSNLICKTTAAIADIELKFSSTPAPIARQRSLELRKNVPSSLSSTGDDYCIAVLSAYDRVRVNGLDLANFSMAIRDHSRVVEAAILHTARAFQFASERLRGDVDLVALALGRSTNPLEDIMPYVSRGAASLTKQILLSLKDTR